MDTEGTTYPTCSALALLHVLPHTSTEDGRPILQGVYFRPDGVVIATNGHTLGMYQAGHTVPGGAILRFPKSAAAILKRAAKKCERMGWNDALAVVIRFDVAGTECLMLSPFTGESVTLEVVDGPFPNVQGVLPWNEKFAAVEQIAVDATLYKRFYTTGSNDRVQLRFQAPERAIGVTTADPKFYGLLMPVRIVGEASGDVPDWTREPGPAAERAA